MAKKRQKSKFQIEKGMPISEKVAMDQTVQFCKRYDIDIGAMTAETAETAEEYLDAIVEYVRRGYIKFEKDFSITQILQDHYSDDIKEITYKKIGGKAKRAMDGYEKTEYYGKTYAVLGKASGLGEDIIEELTGTDLKIAEVIGMLFLQS